MRKLFLFSIGLMLPVFVFAAGAGGGGGGSVSGDTSGFLAPSIGSAPPPSVVVPEVEEKKSETKKPDVLLPPIRTHWCSSLPRLQQRVECRLGLSSEDLVKEYAHQYLPEECRALRNGKTQSACIARYTSLQPCWAKAVGDERTACAKDTLGVPADLSAARSACVALFGKTASSRREATQCLASLRQKIYHLVKFRFYDLNERVEDFLQAHPTVDGRAGIRFIVASELQKQRFNTAGTKAQRIRIIQNERTIWKQFLQSAALDDKRDFLDAAEKELLSVE